MLDIESVQDPLLADLQALESQIRSASAEQKKDDCRCENCIDFPGRGHEGGELRRIILTDAANEWADGRGSTLSSKG